MSAPLEPPDLAEPPPDCLPAIRAIHGYWQHLHPRPGVLPGRQHLDPTALGPLLPNVWLLTVVPAPDAPLRWHFRYRLVGTELARVFGQDPTGHLLHQTWPRIAAPGGVYAHHVAVVEQRRPSYRRGRALYDAERSHHWIERILLPMARDGATVDMLLGFTVMQPPPAYRDSAR